jgi:hypothetical protein
MAIGVGFSFRSHLVKFIFAEFMETVLALWWQIDEMFTKIELRRFFGTTLRTAKPDCLGHSGSTTLVDGLPSALRFS